MLDGHVKNVLMFLSVLVINVPQVVHPSPAALHQPWSATLQQPEAYSQPQGRQLVPPNTFQTFSSRPQQWSSSLILNNILPEKLSLPRPATNAPAAAQEVRVWQSSDTYGNGRQDFDFPDTGVAPDIGNNDIPDFQQDSSPAEDNFPELPIDTADGVNFGEPTNNGIDSFPGSVEPALGDVDDSQSDPTSIGTSQDAETDQVDPNTEKLSAQYITESPGGVEVTTVANTGSAAGTEAGSGGGSETTFASQETEEGPIPPSSPVASAPGSITDGPALTSTGDGFTSRVIVLTNGTSLNLNTIFGSGLTTTASVLILVTFVAVGILSMFAVLALPALYLVPIPGGFKRKRRRMDEGDNDLHRSADELGFLNASWGQQNNVGSKAGGWGGKRKWGAKDDNLLSMGRKRKQMWRRNNLGRQKFYPALVQEEAYMDEDTAGNGERRFAMNHNFPGCNCS